MWNFKFFTDVQPVTCRALSRPAVMGRDTHPYQKRGSPGRQWFRFRWARAFFLFRTNSWSRIFTSVLATAPDTDRETDRHGKLSHQRFIYFYTQPCTIYRPILKTTSLSIAFPAQFVLQCLHQTVPSCPICDTNMRVITTSIHTWTDNGFLPSYRVHNLASDFHWNSSETTGVLCNSPRRRTSWGFTQLPVSAQLPPSFCSYKQIVLGGQTWMSERQS